MVCHRSKLRLFMTVIIVNSNKHSVKIICMYWLLACYRDNICNNTFFCFHCKASHKTFLMSRKHHRKNKTATYALLQGKIIRVSWNCRQIQSSYSVPTLKQPPKELQMTILHQLHLMINFHRHNKQLTQPKQRLTTDSIL